MTKFRKNTFVKWTDKDEQGTFSYVGQVVKHTDGMVVFVDTKGSEMGVPEDEGTFKPARKPKNWKKPAVNIGRTAMTKAVNKAKKARAPRADGLSKFTVLHMTLEEHRPTSRKEAIALAVEHADMTPAGASTYVAKINKEMKLW
jgi:hypothetical protein